jgi:thiol-disulfide isomerase/thioredoxin
MSVACLLFVALCVEPGLSQTKVPLVIDRTSPSIFWDSLFCDRYYNCGLSTGENVKEGVFGPNSIPIKVWRAEGEFLFAIDTNGDKNLTRERRLRIDSGSSIKVNIDKRISAGRSVHLPFEIAHERVERKGEIIDSFRIRSHYSAVGDVRMGGCAVKISLDDMNRDGEFRLTDASRGTNLRLDLNHDGRFWGKEEHRSSNEIIELCGNRVLVSELNDTRIEFSVTDLVIAKIGDVVPKFALTLLDGKTITSDLLKGKNVVLDFWASWCVPCVENLPELKQLGEIYGSKVRTFSVNVDEPANRSIIEGIIAKYGIADSSSVRGFGDKDPLWKTFGGANLNRMSIPLYVLIDRDGILRYADNGGKNLVDLRNSIDKILPE